MSVHLRCADAWLLLGDQQIAVEVDLGLFLPDAGLWGGVLRHVPRRHLSLAARYCDRLLVMRQGQLIAAGPPADVLTPARLADVFEGDAETGFDGLGNLAVSYRGTAP